MNPMENAVYRDVRGEAVLVGIMAEGASGPEFCYDATYLAAPDAAPLSFSLPLRGDPYALAEFRPYFEGLLPEGPPLRRLAVNLGIDEADWLDMLFRCGLDCVGDVVVDRDAFSCKREYRALSPDDLASLARRPAGQTEALEASRLSLAGTQDKCGLYHDPRKSEDEGWHLPLGGAPSNFIVKFASDEHPHLVVVEKVCLDAARACGIAVPESFLLDVVGRPCASSVSIARCRMRTWRKAGAEWTGCPFPCACTKRTSRRLLDCCRVPSTGNSILPQRYASRRFFAGTRCAPLPTWNNLRASLCSTILLAIATTISKTFRSCTRAAVCACVWRLLTTWLAPRCSHGIRGAWECASARRRL